MEENIKEIPYGVSNFVTVVEQNQYYVDKTMYLPLLEKQPRSLFFIRPRRFGKSIFLSMLRTYYDIAQKPKFEARFGNLWVGRRLQLAGRLPVSVPDFSRVSGQAPAGRGPRRLLFRCFGQASRSFYKPYTTPALSGNERPADAAAKINFLDRQARAPRSLSLTINK